MKVTNTDLLNNRYNYSIDILEQNIMENHLDGFFTNNTPLIEPNNSTNQIIVKTYLRTIYDLDIFLFKPINEKIINIGYNNMHQFITNQKCLLVSHNDYNTNIFVMFLLIFIILKSIKSFW